MGNPLGWASPNERGEVEIKQKTAWELWGLHGRRRELQKEYLDHWEATKSKTGTGRPVDAIIAPVAAYPAPPHGHNSCDVSIDWADEYMN
jgi:Asp-tRNA(Asn)/Glu-tRNA(Gln) amidotransferase A subunit family amidase